MLVPTNVHTAHASRRNTNGNSTRAQAASAGFDVIWGSGFELSASYAVPDAGILSMDIHLEMMRAIGEVQNVPVIADIDTGFGNAVNVASVMSRHGM